MVAALLEVHHDVEERDRLGATHVELIKVPGQNPAVILLLHGRKVHAHDELSLGGDVLEDVGLEATQQVGGQKVVQLGDLVLLGNVLKLLLKLFQGAGGWEGGGEGEEMGGYKAVIPSVV